MKALSSETINTEIGKDKKKKEKREREVYEKDEGIVSKKKRLDSDEVDEMNVSDF